MIDDDGDDEGKMTCPGLNRPELTSSSHERHVPEQLESAYRGRIVFMLEGDVDVSLFAVLRGAPEDEIRDGFPQSRCDEAFPCRFKAGDVQNFVHVPRQELSEKVSHGRRGGEVFSGDQIMRIVYLLTVDSERIR